MKRAVFALVTLLMLVSVSAFAQTVVPSSMNFQGRLAKPDGTPVADNAAQTVTFRLYSALTGGTALWSQTGNVAVRNGAFAVALDFSTGFSGTNTLAAVFAASPYLEVQVGSAAALTPRQPFRSVPYAFNANSANTVPNGSIGLNQLASSVLNFSNLTGTISNNQIAAGSITGDKIASGTLGIGALSASFQQTLGFLSVVSGSPILKGSAATGNSPYSVAVLGNYAYVVNFSNSLQVFDVSNPASPTLKSTTTTGSYPISVAVSGNYAYVVNQGGSLQVFDVSNPASPILKGSAATGLNPQSVAVSGNSAYVVNSGSSSLQVFDVSNPASPSLKSTTTTGSYPFSVAVSGNYAYVLNYGNNSLQVFDVSNPASPVLKSAIGTGSGPQSVAVSGSAAYVLNYYSNSLQVFDVSNPASPGLKSATTTGSGPQSVAVSGNSAYVVNYGSDSLQVFTLSTLVVNNNFQVTGSGLFSGDLSVAGNVTAASINLPNGASSIPLGLNEELGNTTGPIINLDLNFHQAGRNSSYVGGAMRIDGRIGAFPLFQFLSRPASSLTETQIASIDQSGNAVFAGSVKANGVTLTSDARYKTNVATLNNALDDVLSLRGVSYDWDRERWPEKNFSDGKQIGFIAQEIEKIFPNLVFTDANGYKSVNYIGVVPVAVEAIKTLNAKVETLEAKNAQLESRLAAIEKLLRVKK